MREGLFSFAGEMMPKDFEPGSYEWEERIAICMESGLTLQEAERVARAELWRRENSEGASSD